MTERAGAVGSWLARWADEPYAYLTTMGRRTGRPHRIEIWFAVHDGRMYMLSGGRDRSDWVRNLMEDARVTVELADETYAGVAHVLREGVDEDLRAREMLVAKYATPANTLENWKRRSLSVVIGFPVDENPSPEA